MHKSKLVVLIMFKISKVVILTHLSIGHMIKKNFYRFAYTMQKTTSKICQLNMIFMNF